MLLLDPCTEVSTEEPLVMERLVDLILGLDDKGFVADRDRDTARDIGNDLHRIGGISLMLSAYDNAEQLSRYAYILDSSWDGIGSWAF